MHGTVPGADLKQGDGKENNLVYATFTASVKHFVSKELFSISPVFTVVSRKGGNNAYAIFAGFFFLGGGGEGGGGAVGSTRCIMGNVEAVNLRLRKKGICSHFSPYFTQLQLIM